MTIEHSNLTRAASTAIVVDSVPPSQFTRLEAKSALFKDLLNGGFVSTDGRILKLSPLIETDGKTRAPEILARRQLVRELFRKGGMMFEDLFRIKVSKFDYTTKCLHRNMHFYKTKDIRYDFNIKSRNVQSDVPDADLAPPQMPPVLKRKWNDAIGTTTGDATRGGCLKHNSTPRDERLRIAFLLNPLPTHCLPKNNKAYAEAEHTPDDTQPPLKHVCFRHSVPEQCQETNTLSKIVHISKGVLGNRPCAFHERGCCYEALV